MYTCSYIARGSDHEFWLAGRDGLGLSCERGTELGLGRGEGLAHLGGQLGELGPICAWARHVQVLQAGE